MRKNKLQIIENLEKTVSINLTCEMFINEVLMNLEFNKIDYEVTKFPMFLTTEKIGG